MASTFRICAANKCENSSFALCSCCQYHLCIDHLKEHSDRCIAQLPLIADEINQLMERLNAVYLTKPSCLEQLEEWRKAAHQVVDKFCERKRQELIDNFREKEQQKLNDSRKQLNELIQRKGGSQENIDSLRNTLRSIEQNVNKLQHIRFMLHPLIIEDKLVKLLESNQTVFPLPSPHKTIEHISRHFFLLASNKQYVLVDANENLCLLDRNLKTVKETSFHHGNLWDMFWSTRLSQFILVTKEEVFTLDELTMNVQPRRISSNDLWARGTCSDATLFLSTMTDKSSPFIYEYTLLPSIVYVRKFQIPAVSGVGNAVRDIKLQNGSFVIIRGNWEPSSKTSLELRSSKTLECFWSIPIGTGGRCCSINDNDWLVMDYYKKQLLHVSIDGTLLEMSKYVPSPTDAIQWNNGELVVRTQNQINLHKIS